MTRACPPPPFTFTSEHEPTREKVAVFVSFVWVHHVLDFDVTAGKATATTTVCFDSFGAGCPVVDLEVRDDMIRSVTIDGGTTRTCEIPSPKSVHEPTGPVTFFRVIDQLVWPGRHHMTIEHEIPSGVSFSNDRVHSRFAHSDDATAFDFAHRPFLDRYLPANLEFDRYPSIWHVRLFGTDVPHAVFANAPTSGDGVSTWTIGFPAHFRSSSPFFLLAPRDEIESRTFFASSGLVTPLPVDLIGYEPEAPLDDFEEEIRRQLARLESRFGSYPHDRLLVFAQQEETMEYTAAVASTLGQLGHELCHCYFGRCVSPADGDAGWIDEGIADWFARGLGPVENPPGFRSRMGAFSPYRRFTDPAGWDSRASFVIRHLDHRLASRGGMEAFLRELVHRRRFEPLTSKQFQHEVERFGRQSFATDVFDPSVYDL